MFLEVGFKTMDAGFQYAEDLGHKRSLKHLALIT
jgi:hypothetical protein